MLHTRRQFIYAIDSFVDNHINWSEDKDVLAA